jgi:hypothetical protein
MDREERNVFTSGLIILAISECANCRPRHVLNIAIKKADGPAEDFLVLLIVAGIHYRQEPSSMNRLKARPLCIAQRDSSTIIDVPPHFHFAVARFEVAGTPGRETIFRPSRVIFIPRKSR